jgi:hypothetical protein
MINGAVLFSPTGQTIQKIGTGGGFFARKKRVAVQMSLQLFTIQANTD